MKFEAENRFTAPLWAPFENNRIQLNSTETEPKRAEIAFESGLERRCFVITTQHKRVSWY